MDGDSISSNLPSQWRNLPSLALPDGSHTFNSDSVYFHLPALYDPRQSVFGISCYRQIDADRLVNKTEDITRQTVQKSVCVISRLPLYDQIRKTRTLSRGLITMLPASTSVPAIPTDVLRRQLVNHGGKLVS